MKLVTILVTAVLFASSLAHASLTGLASAPLGDRSSPTVQFATWDLFPSAVITNLAAQSGSLGLALSQSVSSGAPYGPQPGAVANDLFYTFSKASNFTLSGTSTIDINTVVLQIKLSSPASGTLTGFLTTTLNGVSASPVVTATGIEPGGLAGDGYSVLQYTWSSQNIPNGQTFNINFSNPAGQYHVAFDSVAVDVAPVPEPSTYGLAAVALLGVLIWRRRFGLRKAAA